MACALVDLLVGALLDLLLHGFPFFHDLSVELFDRFLKQVGNDEQEDEGQEHLAQVKGLVSDFRIGGGIPECASVPPQVIEGEQ